MTSKKLHIKELRIKAPGLTRAEGRRLGQLVADHLAETGLSLNQSRQVSELTLRIKAQNGNNVARIAETIAGQIRRRLS
jgi:hypothetical protein